MSVMHGSLESTDPTEKRPHDPHPPMAAAVVSLALAMVVPFSEAKEPVVSLTLTSPAFTESASIPSRHTCDGQDVSPPLQWSGVPSGARSLVLIVDDPDAPDPAAPKRTWVHWVLYDIPANATGTARRRRVGAAAGGNARRAQRLGTHRLWRPVPADRRHRYFHKLYALDTVLSDLGKPDKARLLEAMKGHVVAQVELIGTYQRNR